MSGSLLLIAVVWLVLLAPLLLLNRRPVRRTAQALSETRVLHSGDAASEESASMRKRMPTLRKLRPAKGAYHPSDDEELELVEAEPEYIVFDDDADSAPRRFRLGKFGAAAAENAAEEETQEVEDVVEGEVVAEDPEDVDTVEPEAAGTDTASLTDTAELADTEDSEEASEEASEESSEESDKEVVEEHKDAQVQSLPGIPTAYLRGGDVDSSVPLNDEFEEPKHTKEEDDYLYQELGESTEVTEEDMAYVNSRRGRGVYDPVASQRLVKKRQKRRAQVLSVLVALTVLSGVTGVVFDGFVWYVFAAMVVFTGFYLVALRRTAVEEARFRQRRLARMRRARLGVRNTADAGLGVPDRLRRPGAVILEADDMDPEFQNLSYIDSRDYFDYEQQATPEPYEHHVRAV